MAPSPWKESPYKITPVTTEEDRAIKKCLLGYTRPFVRCGEAGYIMPGGFKKYAEEIYNFHVRPDDIWVVSYPRSGTTWTQEMVWLLQNDLDFDTAKERPLFERFPMLELTPYIPEIAHDLNKLNFMNLGNFQGLTQAVKTSTVRTIAEAPSPRFIKTHLPLSLLPPSLLETAKVVYVARDPRDVAVSNYYLHKMIAKTLLRSTFKSFWDAFRNDLLPWTPSVRHADEAWRQRHHPNLHFIFYEDLIEDLPKQIGSMCTFLGRHYSKEKIQALARHLSFDSLRKNKHVNNTPGSDHNVQFIRKGEAGGWKAHFDEKMELQAEEYLVSNLRGLSLSYPSFPIFESTHL